MLTKKSVKIAVKNIMRLKITIGLVVLIDLNGEERCGGVVESKLKMLLVASSPSTNPKKMRKTKWIKRLRLSKKRTPDACVAKSSDIEWLSALKILTSKLIRKLMKKTTELFE